MLPALLPILGSIGAQVAKNLFPDPEQESKRKETEQMFVTALLDKLQEIEKAAAAIIQAEAASRHWLAANWRPLTMLTFVALIVSRWLGYAAPNLSEAEILELWAIVKIGLGGYVVGRSVEKTLPGILEAVKKR